MATKESITFKRGDTVRFKQAPHGEDNQRKGKGRVVSIIRGPKGDYYVIRPEDGTPDLKLRLSALKAA